MYTVYLENVNIISQYAASLGLYLQHVMSAFVIWYMTNEPIN